jgi:hypothetical protein
MVLQMRLNAQPAFLTGSDVLSFELAKTGPSLSESLARLAMMMVLPLSALSAIRHIFALPAMRAVLDNTQVMAVRGLIMVALLMAGSALLPVGLALAIPRAGAGRLASLPPPRRLGIGPIRRNRQQVAGRGSCC